MIMADDFSLGSVGFKSLQSWDDRLGYVHKSLDNLNLKIHKDSRVMICFLPVADGVNIAMKL